MIFGSAISSRPGETTGPDPWCGGDARARDRLLAWWESPELRVGLRPSGVPTLDRASFVHVEPDGFMVALAGELHDLGALARRIGVPPDTSTPRIVTTGFRNLGPSLFPHLCGSFVVVVGSTASSEVWIARDQLGVEPLFFATRKGELHFASALRDLRAVPGIGRDLDPEAFLRFLMLNYNPGANTLIEGVRSLRPGHALRWKNGSLSEERYWQLSFTPASAPGPGGLHLADELRERLGAAVASRIDRGARAGAYLSGGMDSSSVVSVAAPLVGGPLHTYSFRCQGASFDESHYARSVSRHWGTHHHEVPFGPRDTEAVVNMVRMMQEPFSDVGIEMATYVLAREASGAVDYVLTGDGGDELFAGHPVYLADRFVRRFDLLPGLLKRMVAAPLRHLPDSPQKKSLRVKLQRFAYGTQFTPDLYSNRWRVYYGQEELRALLSPEARTWVDDYDPLAAVRSLYTETDAPDLLSRCLYGDYQTVVGFYLRRMEMVRGMGFIGRFPMLDPALVEFVASIPSALKQPSEGAGKDLLREAMKGVLPPAVQSRTDKLGNSVPLKNWLRDSEFVQALVRDHLSSDSLGRRGLLDPRAVERLWQGHLSGRANNSHRLWSLLVFELWCRENLDA